MQQPHRAGPAPSAGPAPATAATELTPAAATVKAKVDENVRHRAPRPCSGPVPCPC